MVTAICVGTYLAVALAMMAYSRWSGGPWIGLCDFMLDVLFCFLWPLSLVLLAFAALCDHICDRRPRGGRYEP